MRKKTLRAKNSENIKNAFSLMEMMIVLLIVAIVAAATAPMVTKKMSRNTGSGDSPWVFTGFGNSIAYNMGGMEDATAIIGASSLPNSWNQRTRLFIDSGDNASHIAFGNGNATPLLLTADPAKGRIGFSNATINDNSIAFGTGQTLDQESTGLIAIGAGVKAGGSASNPQGHIGNNAIAIGNGAKALDVNSISIGNNAQAMNSGAWLDSPRGFNHGGNIAIGASAEAKDYGAIAIGYDAKTNDNKVHSSDYAIAIGHNAQALANSSIAIGYNAVAKFGNNNSVAIGAGATTTESNQIVLGTKSDTVYIPGTLRVGGISYFGEDWKVEDNKSSIWVRIGGKNGYSKQGEQGYLLNTKSSDAHLVISDRRLKNVGEKYTAGLNELKKLDFFHYTFKKDESKTPMVGVMAQDLQKVFPDAVTKGDDGYLRIRLEDMFYAVINAVKELDTKICAIVKNVTDISAKLDAQQKTIEEQQKAIKELQAQNAEFEKRLAKLENNKCKCKK